MFGMSCGSYYIVILVPSKVVNQLPIWHQKQLMAPFGLYFCIYMYSLSVFNFPTTKGVGRTHTNSIASIHPSIHPHNFHIWHSCEGCTFLCCRKDCGLLWVLLASTAGFHTQCIDSYRFLPVTSSIIILVLILLPQIIINFKI